jgi:hypothetical protein
LSVKVSNVNHGEHPDSPSTACSLNGFSSREGSARRASDRLLREEADGWGLDVIPFHGADHPASQEHRCAFQADGQLYSSALQWMMAEKARIFGDRRVTLEFLPDVEEIGSAADGLYSPVPGACHWGLAAHSRRAARGPVNGEVMHGRRPPRTS